MSHQSLQNDQLLILLNRLFETLKKKNLKSLIELNNEKLMKAIILEIEPKFESLVGKFDLTEDNSFGIRYANIVHIISKLELYKETSTDKEKFTINTNFKSILVVNDLLKNDLDQLHLIGEIFLFLSAISSRKDIYIDRIGDMDEIKLFTYFFQVIEKFMLIEKNDDTINQSHLERSYFLNNQISKMKEDYDRQVNTLTQIIKEGDNKNLQLKARNEAMEKEINDYEIKLRDKDHDLETMKSSQAQNFKYQEQLFKDTITASELNNQLNEKEMEITELRKEMNLLKKKHNEEILELKDKIENLEEKLKDTKTKVTKYEKMNIKYKEINTNVKEKRNNEANDPKSKEFLMKENQNLQSQVEKIMKELLGEKEKYFKQEEEKKKFDKLNQELKLQVHHLQQSQLQHHQSNNRLNIGSNKELNMNNISDVDQDNKEGFELGNDSFLCDIKEMKKGTISEKEYNELKNENNDLVKLYKGQIEDINRLSNDKEQLMTENETNKMEIDRLNREIQKVEIEKEKASIQIQKVELNYQKLQIEYERLANDKKINDSQYKEFYEEKKKELEGYKTELNSHKTLNEKILNDKKILLNNYTNLQKEFDKYKSESMNKNKMKNTIQKGSSVNNNNVNNQVINVQNETEILQLKNEIQNLKQQGLQKDETIKALKENYNEAKNSEDIDYYKKLYEDQKSRVNDEHKLISESLYKLAVHFMSLKDDLQKKINPK